MAPILGEMGRRVREEVEVEIKLPSYVDDIHLVIYDLGSRGAHAHDAQEEGEGVRELLERANRVIKEVAEERGLPLEREKEKKLVLRREEKKEEERGGGKSEVARGDSR